MNCDIVVVGANTGFAPALNCDIEIVGANTRFAPSALTHRHLDFGDLPYCNIVSMTELPTHPGRRSHRLPRFDYSSQGAYFVTIVTQHRLSLFGRISEGDMQLNAAGKMILAEWMNLLARFNQIDLDHFVVMPNHFHGIVFIHPFQSQTREPEAGANLVFAPTTGCDGSQDVSVESSPRGTSSYSLGRIIQAFKSLTTNNYSEGVNLQGWRKFPGRLWQRNYHERVIRDERMLNEVREYILSNPMRWELDKENPSRKQC